MKIYKVELTEAEIALISYCLGHAKNYSEQATKIVSKLYQALSPQCCGDDGNDILCNVVDWLSEEYKEPIKLKQWEKDLISLFDKGYSKDYSFSLFLSLNGLKEKGYFKGITDTSMKIEDILKNCEVIDD